MFPDGPQVLLGRTKPPYNVTRTFSPGVRVRWADKGGVRYYLRVVGERPIPFLFVPMATGEEFGAYIESLSRLSDAMGV